MLLVCCGMPRSGSTLQFNVAWKVAETGDAGKRVEWRSSDDWGKADSELAQMVADDRLLVLKMHFPPDNLMSLADQSDRVRFLYVHRDIRDVVYSMKTKFKFSLNHAVQRVTQALDVEKWLLERPSSQVLIQEYGLLLNDLPVAIAEVAGFIGADLDSAQVSRISEELSLDSAYDRSRSRKAPFEHLRRRINRLLGRKVAFADDELMLHPNHVSEHRGKIGIGEACLNPEELRVINEAFGTRAAGLVDDH